MNTFKIELREIGINELKKCKYGKNIYLNLIINKIIEICFKILILLYK